MPRPTKLTPDRQKRICDNVRLGMSYERAAQAAGVSESAFYKWKRRAQEELERVAESSRRKVRKREEIYVQFLQELEDAEAIGEQTLIAKIQASASGGREMTERRIEYDADGNQIKETVTVKQEPPHWTPAAWILERRHPERWARLEKREVEQTSKQIVELTFIDPDGGETGA